MGISGSLGETRVWIGNRRLMDECVAPIPSHLEAAADAWELAGHTVAFYATDGAVTGAIAMGDSIRPDAVLLIQGLKRRGIHTALISGDAEATTASIAGSIGVDTFEAEVLPTGKLECIRQFQAQGKTVAMVGDGINDAPALAAADLGIALGSGTDLAMQAAPVVLVTPALDVFDISRDTLRVVKQNLFWAFLYNTAGITLAITGVLTPILAAVAMVLSSLSVIANSLRLSNALAARPTPPTHRAHPEVSRAVPVRPA